VQVSNVITYIPEGKGLLESQERNGLTMLKMLCRKWVLEAGEK
jgi:hypothetical protein